MVVAASGKIISIFYSPEERGNSGIIVDSGVLRNVEKYFYGPYGNVCIYEDHVSLPSLLVRTTPLITAKGVKYIYEQSSLGIRVDI